MTNKLILFFTLCTFLFSLDVVVTSGMTEGKSYSVLTLEDDEPFNCLNTATQKDPLDRYICRFKNIPLTYPHKSSNLFFSIEPVIEKEKMFLVITPKHQLFAKPVAMSDEKVLNAYATKWIFIGYKEKLPFIMSQGTSGLNFPISITTEMPMHIGALDSDKRPLTEAGRREEVKAFLEIKALFDAGKLDEVIPAVDAALGESKESLFTAELIAYKIRTLALRGKHEHDILDMGELWIENYTSHKDLPEVMLLVAKANIDLGYSNDAQYMIDMLIKDYPKSIYSHMAMIYKGDKLKSSGNKDMAKKYYTMVLQNTTDLDIASIAAVRLAENLITEGKVDEGMAYYKKVFRSNPEYFVKKVQKGYELGFLVAGFGEYSLAGGLGDMVLGKMDKTDDEYKEVLLTTARWHAKGGNVERAKALYDEYLEKFPYEDVIYQVKREYDELFFALSDDNVTAKLASYDDLIEKYGDGEIGEKAFYEKVLLLSEEHRYDEAKEYLGRFTQLDATTFPDISIESAKLVNDMFFYYLVKDRCEDVVFLYKNYPITIDSMYDEKIYGCLFDTYEYKLAQDLCDKNINNTTGHFVIEWIGKTVDIQDRLSNTKRVAVAGEDYIKAMELYGKPVSPERYMKVLRAYESQEEHEKVLDVVAKIIKAYPDAQNMAELYASGLKTAMKLKDMSRMLQYASALYSYQNERNIDTYTPWVEMSYADILAQRKAYEEGVRVLQGLLQKDIKAADRTQALYTQSTYLDQMGMFDLSKKVLKRCKALNSEEKFGKLCKEAVEILEN